MTWFDELLPIILKFEGVSPTNPTGLADIPGDPGKLTNWGISQTQWSRLYGLFPGFPSSVKDLTQDQATTIYKKIFYLPLFDTLPLGLALVCFDCEVNEGLGIKILQRALNVLDDGDFGPISQAALRLALRDYPELIENVLWKRLEHYAQLAKPDTSTADRGFLPKFWIPRLLDCRKIAHQL